MVTLLVRNLFWLIESSLSKEATSVKCSGAKYFEELSQKFLKICVRQPGSYVEGCSENDPV